MPGSGIAIVELRTAADWAAVRAPTVAFEAACAPDLYIAWSYQFETWRLVGQGRPVHLVRVESGGRTVALAFLSQEVRRRLGLSLRNLKAIVHHAMKMAPLRALPGHERQALLVLLRSARRLRVATGAQALSFFKLPPEALASVVDACRDAGRPCRVERFDTCWEIDLSAGLDAYVRTKGRKSIYNIRRSARLLEESLGPLAVERVRGEAWGAPRTTAAWAEFERLRGRSWQLAEARQQGAGQAEAVLAFDRATAAAWAGSGWLDIALLRAGGRVVAGQVAAVTGPVQWVVTNAFDREFQACSPGRVLSWLQLADAFERGDRRIVLGNAAEKGKQFWMNRREELWKVRLPLGGAYGLLWRLGDRLRRRRPAAALPPGRGDGAGGE